MKKTSAINPSHDVTFSVVIPAYNEEAYLPRSLRSVLGQTLRPLEIIVVDDGSTDGTARVAAEFGDRVRCVRQPNAGLSAARNRGIREASGTFVAFLDADDEWLPRHLEDVASVLAPNPHLHWCCTAYEQRAENGRLEYRAVYTGPLENGAFVRNFCEAAGSRFVLPSSIVIRKQVLMELGGFDERIRTLGEDLDLWFRIALRHPEIGYARAVSAVYWRRPGSIVTIYTQDSKPSCERLWRLIQRTERYAADAGPAAVKRSEPLTLAWVGMLMRRAIDQNEREMLRRIRTHYGRRLHFPDRWILLATTFVPCAVLDQVLALGSRLKRLLRG